MFTLKFNVFPIELEIQFKLLFEKFILEKKQANVTLIRYLELPHDRCYKCKGIYDGLIDAWGLNVFLACLVDVRIVCQNSETYILCIGLVKYLICVGCK